MSAFRSIRVLFILLSITLTSCATITPLGPDTYLIEGGSAVTAHEAENKCAQTGKKVLVTNLRSARSFIFKCLESSSPDYVAPTFNTVPNTVIEDRRQK